MQPIDISIVLPTYNGAKYIRTSIESCLNQTFKNFELIIVNDCSTDDTVSVIEEYALKDPRIKIIHNVVNKKLPLSLNTGFDAATGKYHTWTSDDNYYAPNALETLFNILQTNADIGFLYTDYTIINDENIETGKRTFGDINKNFTAYQGCSASFLYRSELYKLNNGYNPAAFLIEDYDFFVRAFINGKVLYVNRYDLYYYREHGASLTATQGDNVNDIAKIIIEKHIPALEQILPQNQLSLLYRKYAVYNAIKKDNIEKYVLYIKKLWSISKQQTILTLLFVPFKKLVNSIRFMLVSCSSFIKLLLKARN